MFVEKSERPEEECIHQALHHQFIASTKTVKYMKETAPHCVVGNMIARLQNYVYTCNPKDVLVTQQQSQFNLFPTDGKPMAIIHNRF